MIPITEVEVGSDFLYRNQWYKLIRINDVMRAIIQDQFNDWMIPALNENTEIVFLGADIQVAGTPKRKDT